jgi:hypothetical protein
MPPTGAASMPPSNPEVALLGCCRGRGQRTRRPLESVTTALFESIRTRRQEMMMLMVTTHTSPFSSDELAQAEALWMDLARMYQGEELPWERSLEARPHGERQFLVGFFDAASRLKMALAASGSPAGVSP